ncbi:MAG: hypothetical protein JW839_13290 [Candidatus Lokiarchaeota archaeon]|nr:hypothetical protein [Candidatus Lokiarchaeota archaeon]
MYRRKVSRFDYLIDKKLVTDAYKAVEAELAKTRNLLLYATWDDDGAFERLTDRRRGLGCTQRVFNKMVELVKRIDAYCIENQDCRIVLISKKAKDWEKILRSRYFDLRYFEQMGLSFSQSFHLAIANCVATLGQVSSMLIWFCYQENRNHLVFVDYPVQGSGYFHAFDYFAKNEYEGSIEALFKNPNRTRNY